MAFEAKDYAISDILNKSVFDIPRNQRRYVWKKPHWQDLYEDIVFSITETKPHFVGSIVLEGEGKKDGLSYYTIIDGQQRLTTITIVLLAIMKHFHENDMTDDFLGTISYLQSKNNSNQDITILNSEYHVSLSSLIRNMIALKDKSLSIVTEVVPVSICIDELVGYSSTCFSVEVVSWVVFCSIWEGNIKVRSS